MHILVKSDVINTRFPVTLTVNPFRKWSLISPSMGVPPDCSVFFFFFWMKNTEYYFVNWREMQTVRCQFVLKQNEQLQGKSEEVWREEETLERKKSSNIFFFVTAEKKEMLSDLTAVFASCSPDMCCTSGYCRGVTRIEKKIQKNERLE